MSIELPQTIAHDSQFIALLSRFRAELAVLPDKPDETPENTLLTLWAFADGRPLALSQLANEHFRPLDHEARERLRALADQRLAGTPLAHLTGRQDFMGVVLLAGPAALVPRRETELLGYAAAEKAAAATAMPLVVDVCTGAGNLALGISSLVRSARVFGSDLSMDAVELARANARHVGREDVEFRCGDLLTPFLEAPFLQSVDVLVCNPPYISSGRVGEMPVEISGHEPRLAFDGGPFGVGLLRRLVAEAPRLLKPGGWLLFEVGSGQGEVAARLVLQGRQFTNVERLRDGSNEVRAIAAAKAG